MKPTLSHPLQLIQSWNALTREFSTIFPGVQMRFLRVDYSRIGLDDMRAQVWKHSKHTRTGRQRTAGVVRDALLELELNTGNTSSNHTQKSLWICGGSSKSFIQEQKAVRVEEEENKKRTTATTSQAAGTLFCTVIVLTSRVQPMQHIQVASCLAMCRASRCLILIFIPRKVFLEWESVFFLNCSFWIVKGPIL